MFSSIERALRKGNLTQDQIKKWYSIKNITWDLIQAQKKRFWGVALALGVMLLVVGVSVASRKFEYGPEKLSWIFAVAVILAVRAGFLINRSWDMCAHARRLLAHLALFRDLLDEPNCDMTKPWDVGQAVTMRLFDQAQYVKACEHKYDALGRQRRLDTKEYADHREAKDRFNYMFEVFSRFVKLGCEGDYYVDSVDELPQHWE